MFLWLIADTCRLFCYLSYSDTQFANLLDRENHHSRDLLESTFDLEDYELMLDHSFINV